MQIRQTYLFVQEILQEGGRALAVPCRRVAACGATLGPSCADLNNMRLARHAGRGATQSL